MASDTPEWSRGLLEWNRGSKHSISRETISWPEVGTNKDNATRAEVPQWRAKVGRRVVRPQPSRPTSHCPLCYSLNSLNLLQRLPFFMTSWFLSIYWFEFNGLSMLLHTALKVIIPQGPRSVGGMIFDPRNTKKTTLNHITDLRSWYFSLSIKRDASLQINIGAQISFWRRIASPPPFQFPLPEHLFKMFFWPWFYKSPDDLSLTTFKKDSC